MKINWAVRFKNPVFWTELVAAVLLPIFTHMGVNWEDMTTWATLGNMLLEALRNPVVLVAVVISVTNAINDPYT